LAGERKRALVSKVVRREREQAISRILGKHGFALTDFDVESPMKLVHKETEEHFDFGVEDLSKNEYPAACYSVPGADSVSRHSCGGFHQLTVVFDQWCVILRQYLERVGRASQLPDLFSSASREDSPMQVLVLTASLENRPFSPPEVLLIAQKLGELEAHIKESRELTLDQLQILSAQIKYLAESSTRLGRKDWLSILLSVLFSLAISGVFAPERAEELMRYGFAMFQFLVAAALAT
jgi:hypothetical protein